MAEPIDILMPKLGLTMTEGILAEWNVAAGSTVRAGDTIFSVETEKVVNEVEAQQDGIVETLLVPVGTTVPVGSPVAKFRAGEGASAPQPAPAKSETPAPSQQQPRAAAPMADTRTQRPTPHRPAGARIIATPLARRLAREGNIDLAALSGTGPRGRIKAADLVGAKAGNTIPSSAAHKGGGDSAAFSQFVVDVDVARIIALQAEVAAVDSDLEILLCAFLVAALARSSARSPMFDGAATIDVRRRSKGAVVISQLESADKMRLSDISRAIVNYAGADVRGAAIAVSDMSIPALRLFTPRLELGQLLAASIGAVGAHSTANVTITIDGSIDPFDAAEFIEQVVNYLEHPMGLLV